MSDLRIADVPELTPENIEDGLKIPTGGFGNYTITTGTIADWLVSYKDLALKSYVDSELKKKADKTFVEEEFGKLGTASHYDVEDLELIDSQVKTWSGRTQDEKNKDVISPSDYQAKGDGVTDDTQAFIDIEESNENSIVDLKGLTYQVDRWFTKNKYTNGFFYIKGNIYNCELDIYSLSKKKLAMNFYTGDSNIPSQPEIFAGAKNSFQAFCIVPMTDGLHLFVTQKSNTDDSYTDYGNFLKGETYRIVEYMFKEDGSTQQPLSFSKPLNTIGHASDLGYRFENGQLYLYSGAPNQSSTDSTLGGKGFSRIRWNGSNTSNSDITIYELFDQPNIKDGKYPNLCKCAVSVSSDGKIVLRGDIGTTQKVVIYDLDQVLTSSNPKLVDPLVDLVIPNEGRTFQGIDLHEDKLFVLVDDISYTGTLIIYDLSGTKIRELSNIELAKYYSSNSKFLGGEGSLLNIFEMEGVYVFANSIFIGHREYWQSIDTVISYNSKLYAPKVESIPVGTLPTDFRYFQEVNGVNGITPQVFDSSAKYTYGSQRKEIHKRITRLSDVIGDSLGDSNQITVVPKLKSDMVVDVPNNKSIYFRYWDESKGFQDFFYFNATGETRLYKPNSIYKNCALRISTVESPTDRFVRIRGDEAYGGTIQLRSKDDSTDLKGGIVEYVGISSNMMSRSTSYNGETVLNSRDGFDPLTTQTQSNGNLFNGKRAGQLKYSVYVNSGYTWITSKNNNILRFVSSTGDELTTSKALELSRTALLPVDSNGLTLGSASNLWSNIYSSNGTINTSDENYKTQITSLSDKERLVAKSIKPLIKKFKMKGAVSEKGKDARWHIGVIAQEVVKAFEAQGLDPFEYGIVCYDEWEAKPAIVEQDGTVSEESKEAGSRYAIRYDELAMFILSSI